MDVKHGKCYPIFIIDDQYGGRGLNFRAQTSSHGITMLICGSFQDEITRNQALLRVGRFGDKCIRIQDSTFREIDLMKNAKLKG